MMSVLFAGMFDFLQKLLPPLWALVGLVFLAILIVLSKTIIKSAKRNQSGEKPSHSRLEFSREIEPYSEMPYVRVSFDGNPPIYNKLTVDNAFETEVVANVVPEVKTSIRKDMVQKNNK